MLKLDKELAWFPVFSGIAIVAFLALLATVEFAIAGFRVEKMADNISVSDWRAFADIAIALFGIYAIGNYFRGALIASALHRFADGDPDVRYGLHKARARWKSLLIFSVVQATLGLIFRIAHDRLPILGKIGVLLVDIAWHLASLFAVPVIVMSEREISPLSAVRQSAAIFTKSWGKNFVGGFFIGVYVLAAILLWGIISIVALALAALLPATLFLIVPAIVLALILILATSSALNGIFIAALYHFVTTGASPEQFDQDLLRAAFKPKRGWFT